MVQNQIARKHSCIELMCTPSSVQRTLIIPGTTPRLRWSPNFAPSQMAIHSGGNRDSSSTSGPSRPNQVLGATTTPFRDSLPSLFPVELR
mmetsp:Transcript_17421/g.26974  ORF Transcript_17421/g.26974 Transcript_17421/m.26974 type:complete len:90 (-) Transcript_17421:381-650(-)